jgi:hypothetical protein
MPSETVVVVIGVLVVFGFFSLLLEWASRNY